MLTYRNTLDAATDMHIYLSLAVRYPTFSMNYDNLNHWMADRHALAHSDLVLTASSPYHLVGGINLPWSYNVCVEREHQHRAITDPLESPPFRSPAGN